MFVFISMHVSKKNVPLRELCPKKMSQREENARINTADDLEQFGHKSSQNSKPNSKIRINPNLSSKNIIPVMIIYT